MGISNVLGLQLIYISKHYTHPCGDCDTSLGPWFIFFSWLHCYQHFPCHCWAFHIQRSYRQHLPTPVLTVSYILETLKFKQVPIQVLSHLHFISSVYFLIFELLFVFFFLRQVFFSGAHCNLPVSAHHVCVTTPSSYAHA